MTEGAWSEYIELYSSGSAAVCSVALFPPAEGVTQLPTPKEELSREVISWFCTEPTAVNPVDCPSSIVLSAGLPTTDTVTVSTCKVAALENTFEAPAADTKQRY